MKEIISLGQESPEISERLSMPQASDKENQVCETAPKLSKKEESNDIELTNIDGNLFISSKSLLLI